MASPGLRLDRLFLTRFRNYQNLVWNPGSAIAVVTGANGSGKTNLLEAISLLVPGRGLRGARVGDFPWNGSASWAVHGRFSEASGNLEVATGASPDRVDRRIFRLNGAVPRSQAELAARVAAVWLTPQMDRLFQEGASGRRRFLDRLAYALEPTHARAVAAFDSALAERRRLLLETRIDSDWLDAVEESMARHAVAATATRLALVHRVNGAPPPGGFPSARLELICPIAARLACEPALGVEEWLRRVWAASRQADNTAGSTVVGAHRADLNLADAATGRYAGLASTGQQKALLIGVILAHAILLAAARGAAPILLLDEPVVHLDRTHRAALFAALADLPAQSILSGTDIETFASLRRCASFFDCKAGHIEPIN